MRGETVRGGAGGRRSCGEVGGLERRPLVRSPLSRAYVNFK